MWIPFVVVAAALVMVAAPTAIDSRPKSRRAAVERYARRVNIAVTPDVGPRVERRLVRRDRAILAAGLTGVAVAVVAGLLLPDLERLSYLPLVIMTSGFVGVAVGAAAVSLTEALMPSAGPRIARSSTPGYDDYVAPVERWSARGAVVLAVLSVAGAVIAVLAGALGATELTVPAVLGSLGSALALVSVLALLATELLARRILAKGQPAASATELAWDDALRATTLRDLILVPMIFGCSSVLSTFLEVGVRTDYQGAGAPAALFGLVALGVLFAVLIAAAVWALVTKSHQYYWRRLWAPGAESVEAASA